LVDWTSKLPGATARIAALLALADEGTGIQTIGIEPVRRAVALAEKLIPHAEAAFALMGAADGESDAQAVLAYIQRHQLQTVVRHELHKAMEGRFRKVAPLLEAIKLLQEWRVLGPERRTAGVGRPSVYYEVNPRLFVEKSIS
jgi:putative DNA primase/helicase